MKMSFLIYWRCPPTVAKLQGQESNLYGCTLESVRKSGLPAHLTNIFSFAIVSYLTVFDVVFFVADFDDATSRSSACRLWLLGLWPMPALLMLREVGASQHHQCSLNSRNQIELTLDKLNMIVARCFLACDQCPLA